MKPILLFAALLCSASLSAQTSYFAPLSGHQEVPSASTPAEGSVQLTLSGTSLRVNGSVDGLTSPVDLSIQGGAHIHLGYTGSNGPIKLPLEISEGTRQEDSPYYDAVFTNRVYILTESLADSLAEAMDNGSAYVNVHTLTFPMGETRGQILRDRANVVEIWDAMLYGDQQNPAVTSDGIGGIVIEQTDSDSIYVSGSFTLDYPLEPVGGTGAHLHLGLVGQNGPVKVALNPTMSEDGLTGTFLRSGNALVLPADVVDPLAKHNIYVNIHSAVYPGGEIRGQVVSLASNAYFSYVSDNEPTATPNAAASMRMIVEKIFGEDAIAISGSYAGYGETELEGLTPYLLLRNVRVQGSGLQVTSLPEFRDADNTGGTIPYTFFEANDQARLGLYERIQTAGGFINSAGAVRYGSTFYHECKRAFYSPFTASQTVPDVASLGSGEFVTEYYTNRIEVTGRIDDLSGPVDTSVAGGLHIHDGMVGRSGPIVTPISFIQSGNSALVLPTRNVISILPDTARMMVERGLYYNVHTAQYPMGELRGQIVPRANTYFHSVIASGQTVPATGPAEARGAVLVEAFGESAIATGTFDQVYGGFDPNVAGGAHLHTAIAGRSGGIRQGLVSQAAVGDTSGTFMAIDNEFALTPGLLDTMLARGVYVNIHSQARPSGELRGQLTPLTQTVAHAKLSTDVTKPYTRSAGMGHLAVEVYRAAGDSSALVVTGSWDSLATAVDTSVAGGAHFHGNTVAQTGGILFPLLFETSGDSTSATLFAPANTLAVSDSLVTVMQAGDVYANIHTFDAPSGAIRGQVLRSLNQYPSASAGFSFPGDGSAVNLNDGDSTDVATIDWANSTDPDAEQDVAYIWQLYTDTTAMPVLQTEVSDSSGVSFTFGQLDSLLASLGVDSGAVTTVYHRAVTTDGSLLTPTALAAVDLQRVGDDIVATNDLPAASARLLTNLIPAGGDLQLEVRDLPLGKLRYRIVSTTGQELTAATLNFSGGSQRFTISGTPGAAGLYVLQVADARGRSRSWLFSNVR